MTESREVACTNPERSRRQGIFRQRQRVPQIGTKTQWNWDVPGLYHLYGDDELFDNLGGP